jgi:regulator of sirC expression with transglutaminase-like and TPR domain
MSRPTVYSLIVGLAISVGAETRADLPEQSVEKVSAVARKSLVVISFAGRDGKRQGLGAGFVVSADGLIATNFHVLGDGRAIVVETPDGKRHPVTEVHASDRALDLAVIRTDAKDLVPLKLGDSKHLKDGQAIVAVGNPHGLTGSVVSGVVSGKREIDGRSMIQLAIPIEPGNSGGPLLDLHGRVQGILTMKSAITPNLGFAMPIEALKPLLEKPNPISMDRWLAIGALDPAEWKPVFEAHWRRQAGRIVVDGAGSGFGGRAICLWQPALPPLPFEVAVSVRLDDESGAAGLVFDADGRDKHYGFYPSGGQLRLTRFEGPDVYSWTILSQQPSAAYKAGEWNQLKIRVEKNRVQCYVNNQLVVESADRVLAPGRVGLAKFRNTRADFKGFQVGPRIEEAAGSRERARRIERTVAGLVPGEPVKADLLETLQTDVTASAAALRERARRLDQDAALLRELAQSVHEKSVQTRLIAALRGNEDQVDLVRAALLVACLDNEELDPEVYCQEVARMGKELAGRLGKGADDKAKIAALNGYFFSERGFHGSRVDYDNRANSYLNDVLDDREGLPISLSIIYMELAQRIGLKIAGVGLPGHFVVRHIPAKGDGTIIDVFNGGRVLTQAEAEEKIRDATGRNPRSADFAPITKRAIIVRVLRNLMSSTRREGDLRNAVRYLDAILALEPEAAQDRLLRALGRMQIGNRLGALADTDWLLEHHPEGIDTDRVVELRQILSRPER